MPDLTITHRRLTDLSPYEHNPRTHGRDQVEALARNIREFGWTLPLLVNAAGVILAGHGRYAAAQHLDLEEVPCIQVEHLTDQQQRAFRIADNKLAERAGWDRDMLTQELHDLQDLGIDLTLTGFAVPHISDILAMDTTEAGTAGKAKPLKCPHCNAENPRP